MKKFTITIFTLLIFISCSEHKNKVDPKSVLTGNTFELKTLGYEEIGVVEFNDSTYKYFEYDENIPWNTTSYKDLDYIILGSNVGLIDQINADSINLTILSNTKQKVCLKKKQKKWDKELLNGEWIIEKPSTAYLNDSLNASAVIPPMIDMPDKPLTSNPYYSIEGDSITAIYYFQKSKSKFEINNYAGYAQMKLENDLKQIENKWKIKEINDSIMIIDKSIHDWLNMTSPTIKDIKLIRKR